MTDSRPYSRSYVYVPGRSILKFNNIIFRIGRWVVNHPEEDLDRLLTQKKRIEERLMRESVAHRLKSHLMPFFQNSFNPDQYRALWEKQRERSMKAESLKASEMMRNNT